MLISLSNSTWQKILGYGMIAIFAALMFGVAWLVRSDPTGISESVPVWAREAIEVAAEKYDLQPSLIAAVIHKESSWRVDAISRTDHRGLMQISPERAAQLNDWQDPMEAVDAGSSILAYYIGRARTDIANEGSVHGSSSPYEVGLAYYNAGRMGARTTENGWEYAKKVLQLQQDIYTKDIIG
jgi:soluble lytic murein transglycosylase-like protein